MTLMTWIGIGSLAMGIATIAAAQWETGEPIRPGGVELSYHPEEGLGAVPPSTDGAEPISAEAQARSFVRSHPGLQLGWHHVGTEDEYVVVVASHAIAPVRDRPYGDARRVAFEVARAGAGLELAAMAGSRIDAEVERLASEADMSPAELSELVSLRFKGALDADRLSGLAPQQRVAVEEFSSRVARECDRMIAGLQVFKVFEGPEDIAIVATWSGGTRRMVEALRTAGTPIRGKAAQVAIADWAGSIGEELLYSHGCQLRTDEHGEVGVVAFGQADMAGSSRRFRDLAKAQAGLVADAALARFVTELIASSQDRGLASLALETGFGEGAISLSKLESTYREQFRSKSDLPDLPAATEIEVREFVHPRNGDSGARTVCVVKHLNLSSLQAQERMRRWMESQASRGNESKGDRPIDVAPASPDRASDDATGPNTDVGQGVTGESP